MSTKQGVVAYKGRTVDLRAFVESTSFPSTTALAQELVSTGNAGAAVTGISKLIQRVLVELLTIRGSLTYLPTRGTLLMLQLRLGTIRTSADLFAAFSSAATDVVRQLRLEDRATDPADERITQLEMLSADLSGDKASVRARVVSAAGEDREIFIPLDISPTPLMLERGNG